MSYLASDYLKSNCRSYENDCDNEDDTMNLAQHLYSKLNISAEDAYIEAANWTGYSSHFNNLPNSEKY